MLSTKELRQNYYQFGHDIHLARRIFHQLGWQKTDCCMPPVKAKDQMSQIPKFGAPVTEEEYARKWEQPP
jgi:hypothetical protein